MSPDRFCWLRAARAHSRYLDFLDTAPVGDEQRHRRGGLTQRVELDAFVEAMDDAPTCNSCRSSAPRVDGIATKSFVTPSCASNAESTAPRIRRCVSSGCIVTAQVGAQNP
jgi:hypothetical protein